MKNLIEEKIYMLSKIKPEKEWKKDTKKNISGEEKLAYVPFLRNGAVLVGSVALVFLVVFWNEPFSSPKAQVEETQVAEKEIKESFAGLEESLYQIQRSVLGRLVENGEEELTDKEIAEYHVLKIEEKEDINNEDEEKEKKLEEAKRAIEEENVGEAFKIIIDILAEEN